MHSGNHHLWRLGRNARMERLMTQNELTKLIHEFLPYPSEGQHYALRQFAKLVAKQEREACAEIADNHIDGTPEWNSAANNIAQAIRAREQA